MIFYNLVGEFGRYRLDLMATGTNIKIFIRIKSL